MPRRTNRFQQLVFLLQTQLAERALVTESDMLRDQRTGSLSEVDVTLKTEVNGIPITVGIECTAEGRRADINWVRRMVTKRDDLRIHKMVLVSEKGFSKDAGKLAESHNIDTFTLREATDRDWMHYISDRILNLATMTFDVAGVRVDAGSGSLDVSMDDAVRVPDTEQVGTMLGYAKSVVGHPEALQKALQEWEPPSGPDTQQGIGNITLTIAPAQSVEILREGNWVALKTVSIDIVAHFKTARLDLKSGKLGPHQIAHGAAPNILSDNPTSSSANVVVNMVGDKERIRKVSALIPSTGAAKSRIIDFTFPSLHDEGNGTAEEDEEE